MELLEEFLKSGEWGGYFYSLEEGVWSKREEK